MTLNNGRIVHIDALRGIAILLVVYSHLLFILPEKPISTSLINQFFYTFRMPLFFFISGFFVYSECFTVNLLKKRILNRFVCQLYPTIIIFGIFITIFYDSNYIRGIYNLQKRGYWFTLAVVEMFLMVVPLLYFISKTKRKDVMFTSLCVFCYGAIVFGIVLFLKESIHWKTSDAIGIHYLALYFPYFLGGMFIKTALEKLHPLIINKYFIAGCLIVYICGFCILKDPALYYINGFAAVFIINFIAYSLFRFNNIREHIISKAIRTAGAMTLEVYLLHYFIIHASHNLLKMPWLKSIVNTAWEFPILISMSIIIVAIVLLFVRFLKIIKIYPFLFPKIKKKERRALPEAGLITANP